MGKKMLFAVDGSERGLQAASILGNLLENQTGYEVMLFHCVQQLAMLYPGEFADMEISQRFSLEAQNKVGKAILDASQQALVQSGFPEDRIISKIGLNCSDPAQAIMAEAENELIRTVILGRRGRSPIESLLLGSVSSKVAQYARHRSVWIVDTPINQSRKVLIAMAGAPDSRALTQYTAEFLAPIPHMHYTFFHIIPPVPPTFWDDGHILEPTEQKDRQKRIEKWRSEWSRGVEKFMDEACQAVIQQGVPEKNVEKRIVQTKEGIARDLLNEIVREEYQMVVIGKRSFHERKPFLMGSHANKVLQNIQKAILCLIDA
jgi:nucleotide-binding universal stress UspA family protein